MSLLSLVKVSLSFAGKAVFHNIGFQVEARDRIGLVGPNGSGKTTLLRMILGKISPDNGEIRISKGLRMGYLPQDVLDVQSGKLLASVVDSAPGRIELESELAEVEKILKATACREGQTRLAEKLAELHLEKNRLDVTFPGHRAEKILLGLGFKTDDFDRQIASLSGGWRTRAALATLLFQSPDLLLLDEPTNHLDIPSVHWLEQFLQDFSGAMILVSHDKDFLNREIQRTIGFEPEGMRSYSGNYDAYLNAREEEQKTLENNARRQDQRVKEAEKFIERFRSKASKARQAQSKIKLLEKMELVQTHRRGRVARFSFPDAPSCGRVVVSVNDLKKGFSGQILYKNLNLTVLRGERIAIIGPNGCGKTTLLRMVAGEMSPDHGDISFGHGVIMSYFAQHHSEMLDFKKTVVEEVYSEVPDKNIGFVRGVCGAFLFSGDDVEKTIGVLSGGEKARVSLAKLLVKPGNLMVMDEPTNHLDISSSEALIKALSEYNGTLMFVSHNQSFVNRLATKIWDIREETVIEYPGSLDEYYLHTSENQSDHKQNQVPGAFQKEAEFKKPVRKEQDRKKEKRMAAERRQLIYSTLKPIASKVEQLEQRIDALEVRQQELEKALAQPDIFSNKDMSIPLLNEYKVGKEKLEQLVQEWEQSQDRLESIKKEFDLNDM